MDFLNDFISSLFNNDSSHTPGGTPAPVKGKLDAATRAEQVKARKAEAQARNLAQAEANHAACLDVELSIAKRLAVILIETPLVLERIETLKEARVDSKQVLKDSQDALRNAGFKL